MQDDDECGITEDMAKRAGLIIERDANNRIISARMPNPFIVDQLLDRGILDREQHWHAEQFIAMRMVFLRPVGTTKTVMVYQSEPDGAPPPKYPIADNDYLIVLKDMRHDWQKQIVMAACDDRFSMPVMYHLTEMPRQRVANAFDALTRAINRLLDKKKEIDDARKNALALDRRICQYAQD